MKQSPRYSSPILPLFSKQFHYPEPLLQSISICIDAYRLKYDNICSVLEPFWR